MMTAEAQNALHAAIEKRVSGLRHLSERLPSVLLTTLLSQSSTEVPKLDDAERELHAAMALVRQTRNSLSPIDRLPPELLCTIFVEVLHVKIGMRYHWRLRNMYSILMVCRLWNQIACATPILWSVVTVAQGMSAESLCDLLSRSGSSPLQVVVTDGNPAPQLIPHMPRLRKLHVSMEVSELSVLISFLTCPVPNLEALCLLCRMDNDVELPELFKRRTPRLTRLSLHGLWTANVYPNLTHLYLSHVPISRLNSLLDFIEVSPALEDIVLSGIIVLEAFLTTPDRHVALPCLHTLLLQWCHYQVVISIMSALTFPNGAAVAFHNTGGLAETRRLTEIILTLASCLMYPRDEVDLSLWISDRQICMVRCHPKAPFKLDIQLGIQLTTIAPISHDQLMTTFMSECLPRILHLENVVRLQLFLDPPTNLTPRCIRPLLCSMTSVESCTIWANRRHRKSWHRYLSCKHGLVPLPRLGALHIMGEYAQNKFNPSWILGLALSRALHGHPLHSLRCTAVKSPRHLTNDFTEWNTMLSKFRGRHIDTFIGYLGFDAVEDNPAAHPDLPVWDGEI